MAQRASEAGILDAIVLNCDHSWQLEPMKSSVHVAKMKYFTRCGRQRRRMAISGKLSASRARDSLSTMVNRPIKLVLWEDSVNKIILLTRSSFTESASDSVKLQCNCSSTESLSQNNSVFLSSFGDFVNKIGVA